MWSNVSCLRKQHDGGDWASRHRPSGLKSNALTTTPQCPHKFYTNGFILTRRDPESKLKPHNQRNYIWQIAVDADMVF